MTPERKKRRVSGGAEPTASPVRTAESQHALYSDKSDKRQGEAAAWAAFCEEYHDIVEQLPLELKRNFLLVHELEQHMQVSESKLHDALLAHVAQRRSLISPVARRKSIRSPNTSGTTADSNDPAALFSPQERRRTPPPVSPRSKLRALSREIAKESRMAIRAGEDKVQQAVAMYDTVDRHIHRLDADLAKYEDSLVIGLRSGTLPSSEAPSLFASAAYTGSSTTVGVRGGSERPSAAITAAAAVANDLSRSVRTRADQQQQGSSSPVGPPFLAAYLDHQQRRGTGRSARAATAEEEEVEEEEFIVDSSEPIYCSCKRISFGDMIACDNDDCVTEWYHYECVGLREAPKGRWFCRDCVKALGIQAQKGC